MSYRTELSFIMCHFYEQMALTDLFHSPGRSHSLKCQERETSGEKDWWELPQKERLDKDYCLGHAVGKRVEMNRMASVYTAGCQPWKTWLNDESFPRGLKLFLNAALGAVTIDLLVEDVELSCHPLGYT